MLMTSMIDYSVLIVLIGYNISSCMLDKYLRMPTKLAFWKMENVI